MGEYQLTIPVSRVILIVVLTVIVIVVVVTVRGLTGRKLTNLPRKSSESQQKGNFIRALIDCLNTSRFSLLAKFISMMAPSAECGI